MPPKRTSKRAKATPKKEEEVKVEEPVIEEPVVEEPVEETTEEIEEPANGNEDEAEADEAEEAKEEYEKMSAEEKLERIGTVSPTLLFEKVCEKVNHPRPYFEVETVPGEPRTMKVIVHFKNDVLTVEEIQFKRYHSRIRKARNVAADLFLKKLFGDDHEMDARFDDEVKHTFAEDTAWWDEKLPIHNKYKSARLDKLVERINNDDRNDDAKKAEKLARVEEQREFVDTIPAYDDVHGQFDNPYGPILARSCKNVDIEFVRTISKTSGGNTEEMGESFKIPRFWKIEEGVEWKCRMDIKNKEGGEDLMAYEAESEDLHEACSTAAYSCLQQLLEEGHLKRLIKSNSELARTNPKYANMNIRGRFGGRGRGRGGHRGGCGAGRGGNRNGNKKNVDKSAGQLKHEAKLATDQANKQMQAMMKQMQQGGGGMAMPGMGGMMMMPVMMTPDGQMVVMGGNNMQQGAQTKSPNKKNRNKKRKAAKDKTEPAEKVSAN